MSYVFGRARLGPLVPEVINHMARQRDGQSTAR